MIRSLKCLWLSIRDELLTASIQNGFALVQEREAELDYSRTRLRTLMEKRRQVRANLALIERPGRLINSSNSRGIV